MKSGVNIQPDASNAAMKAITRNQSDTGTKAGGARLAKEVSPTGVFPPNVRGGSGTLGISHRVHDQIKHNGLLMGTDT